MKTTRLILGIISMVLVLIIIFQSCAAGIGNIMSDSDETSGYAGFVVLAICFLIAGIVGVATHKRGMAGAIISIIFYTIGGLVGISLYGSFADLQIWSVLSFFFALILSFIFALIFLMSIIIKPKKNIEMENDISKKGES